MAGGWIATRTDGESDVTLDRTGLKIPHSKVPPQKRMTADPNWCEPCLDSKEI